MAQKVYKDFEIRPCTRNLFEEVIKDDLEIKLTPYIGQLFTYAGEPFVRKSDGNNLPKRYIINKGATILFWKDGTKTIVKRCKDDEYNKRLGFLTAYFQKHCGMSKNKANKYLASLEEGE